MPDLDITDAALAELRAASDIVEVVSEHTRLKKAGRSWKGLCPFHNERTPSFTVDRDKGLYHCFGCGAGGDVIHFVRQIQRMEFPEAVETLAARFGVKIPERVSRGPREDKREKLLEAIAAAHRWYVAQLSRPGNRAARYLEERGVAPELARRLGLAYAPEGWENLGGAIGGAYPESLLVEAGLLQPRPEGRGAYDRFRDRLLFVVRDERGRPVGFGGRALSPENEPKYLNSPESPIFFKKRLLYGLSEAREAIRKNERAVLVEGFFDHLALVAAGIEETVASMGTALTPEQAERLRRLSPRVILCYDGDPAGRAATRGAIGHLLAQGLTVHVARLPPGEDPWDLYAREGGAGLARRIEEAPDYLTWLFEDVRAGEPGLPSGEKRERCRLVLDLLEAIPDQILRYEEVRRLSSEVSVPVDVLWRKPGASPRAPAPPPGTPGNVNVLSQRQIPAAERRLLQVLADGWYNSLILETLRDEWVSHPTVRKVVEGSRECVRDSQTADFQRTIARLSEEELALIRPLVLKEEPEPRDESSVRRLLSRLEGDSLRSGGPSQQAIATAESAGEPARVEELLKEKQASSLRRVAAQQAAKRKGKDVAD